MKELYQTLPMGLAAIFWIVVFKFVFGVRFEVSGISGLMRFV